MAGRPTGPEKRDALLQVRVTKKEKAAIQKKAKGLSISDYVRGLIFGEKA